MIRGSNHLKFMHFYELKYANNNKNAKENIYKLILKINNNYLIHISIYFKFIMWLSYVIHINYYFIKFTISFSYSKSQSVIQILKIIYICAYDWIFSVFNFFLFFLSPAIIKYFCCIVFLFKSFFSFKVSLYFDVIVVAFFSHFLV